MIIVFRNETHNAKLKVINNIFACGTWTCRERGEGEEEVYYHGRSRVKVSSQGTDLTGQWSLRMRDNRADQEEANLSVMTDPLSTGCTTDSNSTPLFFLTGYL